MPVRVEGAAKSIGDETLFSAFDLTVMRGEKVVIVSRNSVATSALLETLAGELEPDAGDIEWSDTVTKSFLPKDSAELFDAEINLIDWLRQYSEEKDENFVRGFLGRMLFTGEETQKYVTVLSGGEKIRCMISRLMLEAPDCMILDGPTNHLDLESITSLNKALIHYPGTLIFSSHDQEFTRSIADRVIEIAPDGEVIDHQVDYNEFLRRKTEAFEASLPGFEPEEPDEPFEPVDDEELVESWA